MNSLYVLRAFWPGGTFLFPRAVAPAMSFSSSYVVGALVFAGRLVAVTIRHIGLILRVSLTVKGNGRHEVDAASVFSDVGFTCCPACFLW
jgi:hypothetical protein